LLKTINLLIILEKKVMKMNKNNNQNNKENKNKRIEEIVIIIIFAILSCFSSSVLIYPEKMDFKYSSDDSTYVLQTKQEDHIEKIVFILIFGACMPAVMALLVIDWVKGKHEHKDDRKLLREIAEKQVKKDEIKSINEKIANMAEISALYTEGNVFENNVLNPLRKKKKGVVWIISRFISKQMTQSFEELKISISGKDYSDFSSNLYRECRKSICLTNAFTPVEWLRQIYGKKDLRDILSGNANINSISLPNHLKALNEMDESVKIKRLFIFPTSDFLFLALQSKLLEWVVALTSTYKDGRRFVTIENLKHIKVTPEASNALYANLLKDDEYDIGIHDYAIFDEEILMHWDGKNIDADGNRILRLVDLENDNVDNRYDTINKKLFDYNDSDNKSAYMDLEKVKTKIEKSKKELIDYVSKCNAIPHKYAYWGIGADIWEKIVNDNDYELGINEIDALKTYLPNVRTLLGNDMYNVFHLGTGEGREITYVIDNLWKSINIYSMLDISPELLKSAKINTINYMAGSNKKKIVEIKLCTVDLTNDNSISQVISSIGTNQNTHSLLIAIANGALLSNESVWEAISSSMKKEDKLLLIMEGSDDTEENKNKIKNEFEITSVRELLLQPLKLLGIDIHKDDKVEEYLIYSHTENMLNVDFNVDLWCNNGNNNINKSNCGRINIFSTYKPTKENIRQKLKDYQLKEIAGYEVNMIKNCLASMIEKDE